MATKTAVASGVLETGVVFGLAGSTPSVFAAGDTLTCGTQSLILNSAITQATVTLAAGGTLYIAPGGSLSITTLGSFLGNIVHMSGFIPTTALGSPTSGPSSGGSVPMVFVPAGN